MRKALLLCTVAVFVSALGVGNAAPLAACTGSTSVTPTAPPTIAGSCSKYFVLTTTTSVTLELIASPGFTGSLRGFVVPENGGPGGGFPVEANYIAGSLVTGQSSRTYSIASGAWRLRVETKGTVCNPAQIVPQLPGCTNTAAAIGTFSGSVSPASSGTA